MPRLYREIDDNGNIDYEQTGNMPGTPETENGVAGQHGGSAGVEGSPWGVSASTPVSFVNNSITDTSAPWRSVIGASRSPYDPVTNLQDQARLEQQRVIQALQAQAAGDPNSQAQQQLSQAYGNARSQQSSLGSTMRGQSAGAAMRGIQQGQQALGAQEVGDHQMLMLQEQQAAQAMLAQLLQQQREQDTGWQQGLAGVTNSRNALDNAYNQFNTGVGYGLDSGFRDLNMDNTKYQLGLAQQDRDASRTWMQNFLNAIGTASGGVFKTGGGGGDSGYTGSGHTGGDYTHSDTGGSHAGGGNYFDGTSGSHY